MVEILTVCTGNICRSPLAEQLLRSRLTTREIRASSAGTRARAGLPMTPEAAALAAGMGVDPESISRHRSRSLDESHLVSPDLILTMTREQRRAVAELAPTRLRATFTIRELARLLTGVPTGELRLAATSAGPDASARVRAVAMAAASHRGLVPPPDDPDDDDVVDPYRRSWAVYELSGAQLLPAIDAIAAALHAAMADD